MYQGILAKSHVFILCFFGNRKLFVVETTPGLWIGTNNGAIIPMNINLPGSERAAHPVVVNHSGKQTTLSKNQYHKQTKTHSTTINTVISHIAGTIFQIKGTILELCFLDYNGLMIPVEAEIWTDGREGAEKREKRKFYLLSARYSKACLPVIDCLVFCSLNIFTSMHHVACIVPHFIATTNKIKEPTLIV